MYLLDANIISELRRRRPDGPVVAWLQAVPDSDLHLSAVTLGEIQAGIELTRGRDSAKAAEIEVWADRLSETWNILPMDAVAVREWARLMQRGSDAVLEDAMIAATARVHGLAVVTRNVKDFQTFNVQIVNPYGAR